MCLSRDKRQSENFQAIIEALKEVLTNTNLMPVCETPLSLKRPVYDIAPNVEQRCLLVLTREVVIKGIVRAVWPVVKRVAQCSGLWYSSYVMW